MKNKELLGSDGTGGFHNHVGYKILENAAGQWIVTLDVSEQHLNQYGVAHGGVSLTLMDVAGGVALYAHGPLIKRMATISMSQNFVSSVPPGLVTAIGHVDRFGRAVGYCTMKLYRGDLGGDLLASAQGSYRLFLED
ncbi:MAG: PaaI family thioesterase [Alphaproteobacteria bacterium]|nr:PaaI family thioesterase [Alphaproteobacteria bacterium]